MLAERLIPGFTAPYADGGKWVSVPIQPTTIKTAGRSVIVMKTTTTPSVTTPTQEPAKAQAQQRRGIKWPVKAVTIEEDLGGQSFPHEGGLAWTPNQGRRIELLEQTASSKFYALINQDGGCDIIVADANGLRKPEFTEIPFSVMEKALPYSGGEMGGELIIPERSNNGCSTARPTAQPKKLGTDEARRMAEWMHNADPREV